MAEPPNDPVPSGPHQHGRGVQGQYVYWITQSHPTADVVERLGLRAPAEFSRTEFRELVAECHQAAFVELVETVCFREPHANGEVHNNLLVRARRQYKWKLVAQKLRDKSVHVDFSTHVRTWADGVVYGRVASEHKRPESLDHNYEHWAKPPAEPTPLDRFLPVRWQRAGYVRPTRLSNLAFYDLCKEHEDKSEEELWAKASE